jgi:hypothetical protein
LFYFNASASFVGLNWENSFLLLDWFSESLFFGSTKAAADVENKIAATMRRELRGDHLAVRHRILKSNGSQKITSSYKGLLVDSHGFWMFG